MAIATFESIQMGGLGLRCPAFGTSDPMNVTRFLNSAFHSLEPLRQGMVVTYNPNTHTASVLMMGTESIWPCIFADEPVSLAFGYSSTTPVREGELVLVCQLDAMMQAGVIIGRIPFPLCFSEQGDTYNDYDQYHRRLFTMDELQRRTWDRNIPGMMKPFQNKFDNSTHIHTHFRPTDLYPGEFAHVNQHNCGIKGGMFSATLLGGGASLRLSALSNLARLIAESYQRYTMSGVMHEFHNGRYLSVERKLALFQEERLGGSTRQEKVWKDDAEEPVKEGNQTMRPRVVELSGFFGHLQSKFCLRPDPSDSAIRVQGGSQPKEAGVFRETTDPSGQHRITSSGMLVLERAGRIPVPVRKAYPTDKDHDIESTPEVLTPFEHDDSDPCNRQLELYDRQAYDLKNQYARVDGLGFEPDYDVPQEEELKPLEDKYDPKFDGNETVKLQKFDKRRAGMYIGEDGSVIIRDAWGSEIVMLGGNIQLSCAGNVMIMPGKTAMTIAGDDIVQKAQNSVDIHASEHDVRLSAARNMEILGGGDENKYSGGVIIESRGKSPAPSQNCDEGEAARLSGITLKSKNQAIVVDGKRVHVRSGNQMRIIAGDKDIDGNISIAAKTIRSIAKNTIIAGCEDDDGTGSLITKIRRGLDATSRLEDKTNDESGFGGFDVHDISALSVTKKSVMVVGNSIGLFASNSLAATKGSKFPVPLMWVDIEDIASIIRPKLEGALKDMNNEKDASAGFPRETLDKIMFGFRRSLECRTDRSWVIGDKSNVFKLYEPAWVQVMGRFETLKNGGVDAKPYEENAEWENGKPFPGKEVEDSAEYAQINGLTPSNLTLDGFNGRRDEVDSHTRIESVPLKGGYRIRK